MKAVTISTPDFLRMLGFIAARVGGVASDLQAAIQAGDIEILDLKKCFKCGQFFPATSEYFDEEDRMADGLTNKCIKCRRSYASHYYRDRRREAKLQKQNPGYSADLAEIKRFRDLHTVQETPSLFPDLDLEPESLLEHRGPGRPPIIRTPEELEALAEEKRNRRKPGRPPKIPTPEELETREYKKQNKRRPGRPRGSNGYRGSTRYKGITLAQAQALALAGRTGTSFADVAPADQLEQLS